MFKSKIRPINVPQYEHGRLAGICASHWGNKDFDKPAIHFPSFVQGVTLHDWHFGPIDNLPILEADEADWLIIVRKGIDLWFADPITDIVSKLHLKRLLSSRNTPEVQRLVTQIDHRIAERLPQTGFSADQFAWADKITAFCDFLALDFSFEKPVSRTFSLYSQVDSSQETAVTYVIKPDGEILVDPWPFNLPSFSGLIIGHERTGYPESLIPHIIPYHCQPADPTT